ncbi:hypothetical protein QW180_01045 [Vibrio sinaloensis]|nr:hypothetical protein [Vibrio sinaloensis]
MGDNEIVSRVNNQSITTSDIGKSLRFNFDSAFCHIFFDGDTEQNLTL